VTAGAPGAFYNPAAWAVGRGELAAWLTPNKTGEGDRASWGLSLGGPLGFAMDSRGYDRGLGPESRLRTYQLGFAAGDRRVHVGAAWRWHGGDLDRFDVDGGPVLGALVRPDRRTSVGVSGFFTGDDGFREGIIDVGVRPLGTPLLTLFADYTLRRPAGGAEAWGGGIEVRPVRGVDMTFKVRNADDDDVRYHVGLGVTFDGAGVHAIGRRSEDFDHEATSYLVRVQPPYRGIPVDRELRKRFAANIVVPLDLENKVLTYQRDRWFDETRIAWIDLARYLDAIRDEPGTAGVALNLSSFRGRPSLVWELRMKLAELRAAGKRVYVYADRLDMSGIYLASVADDITLDPQGDLMLPGLAVHRTYLRGALEKLGLGAEEWRFLSHKTAFQTYSRADMSEADKEQLGRLVDVIYETWRGGVCDGRGLSEEAFDAVVNDEVFLLAKRALELDLVDRLGRWSDLTERLGKEDSLRVAGLPGAGDRRAFPDERWGRPPEIAVVYAVGECAMDSGIRGRATGKYMRGLAEDRDVRAVVLRADSPGGDPLPSDLVAEGTRKLKEKGKPVVVSQGDVAASGGYWISMNGSRVLTTPLTITGSIGIIAGWIWDEGFSEKFGLTADGVQRGKHADLFTGIRIPLIDGVVPERAVTEEEREVVKALLLNEYDTFVRGVAEGRGLPEARVREIAEGRVWMGGDAIERGLTDRFGGLDAAIQEARALAGLDPDEEIILTEYPPRKLFSLPSFFPAIPGISSLARSFASARGDAARIEAVVPYEELYLRGMVNAPGRPLLLVPPENLPRGWGEEPTLP
jgi:protease-4